MIQKLTAAVLCLLTVVTAQAQSSSLSYGSAVKGNIDRPGASIDYTFDAAASDLITARVIPTDGAFDPALTLLAPDGSQVSTTSQNELTHWLAIDGTYTLIVSGENDTTGGFVLRLDGEADKATSLAVGQVLRADIPVDSPPRFFRVEQTTDSPLTLTLSANDPAFRFKAAVYDPHDELIAAFDGDVRQTVVTFDAGSGVYQVSIAAADPAQTGVALLDLEPTAAPTSTPAPTLAPSTGQVFCHVSSNGVANIRSSPSLRAAVINRLTSTTRGNVIGISADGEWYALQLPEQVGWVSIQVAREIEPCGQLPILPASP